ncbi:MAG: hypothetical protein IK113_05270 [Bacteroidales bacterium]|nr:hypothetical protein [Bacteroidales bacterium]
MEFGEFILAHEADDLGKLALARDRYAAEVEDFDLALTTLEVRRKLKAKVPEWYAVPGLRYPFRISGEQCSSSETAFYKAAVACSAYGATKRAKTPQNVSFIAQMVNEIHENGVFCVNRCPMHLADLTGGLGVDSWAFSKVADDVLYNEMKPELAAAAERNFRELGMENVTVRNCRLEPGNVNEILCGFGPDIIFLDPARRAEDGRKVFRLEDCQPDVLQLLPELFAAAPVILLKLSPMADITLVCRQLHGVKEVHVVAADGECKELLLLLERGYEGEYVTIIYEGGSILLVNQVQSDVVDQVQGDVVDQVQRDFGRGGILGGGPGPGTVHQNALRGTPGGPGPGGIIAPSPKSVWTRSKVSLFEPGKALLKAGAFDLPCRFGLEKIGRHTHLYTGLAPDELKPFGKCFEILEVLPLNNKTIRELGKRYPQASVTARNIPLTSDQLRKKLGVKDGGTVHIFGLHSDQEGNILVVCGGS